MSELQASERVVIVSEPTIEAVDAAVGTGVEVVVLVSEDASSLGELASRVEAAGARPAVFVGRPDDVSVAAALEAFVAEMLGPRTLAQ